ncbi:MAG: ATP:cob(I)alamin adenosyltransferase [Bacteroidetes bacterium GWF2_42_66]|nr:MAG: ATP:cob(I)alamin adenosyltransferase [Bacteroidetes bacterium GWA2_42_15]OFY01108.1 MAG: ATP:cob(I)alamin adenosyltransferase [Bacteroidetes bacterium GWE2_42_39]OFY41951.1 MAG: ATP:cob(I)alamin adenosyltransferase [Bacteroidetes bacterium GWF2_42_66]HBL77854.1 cob(I)yrinic acid a,c-diamide adenosyltransferase [Prolixibacteraceae bacterium]HCR91491.1 cob(I)yrinic acid a,c-diamide adenosyltransferase [Prolixibacteraceae bacterium]
MAKEPKIYTKTGDDGTTGLIGGSRVKKYDIRLEAYGTVDELNSWLGVIRSTEIDTHSKSILEQIQKKLFVIGAILASGENASAIKEQLPCNEEDIALLEKEMDQMVAVLPKLSHFILPGGCLPASYCHIARTVCRRAERRIVELSEKTEINPKLVIYVNRLSDYLFVLSRSVSQSLKVPETLWIQGDS